MNARLALALASLAALSTGCMYSSESGEITGRMVSDWERTTQSAEGSWNGEPIIVHNEMGGVHVIGVEGQTHISVTANFVAGANSQEEAQPAFEDVARSMQIELDYNGFWQVRCNPASQRHGDVVPSTTGCDMMTVRVPAGAVHQPVDLRVSASFGGAAAEKVVASRLHVRAPFGVLAEVDPVVGADIEVYNEDLVMGDCPAELYLPPQWTADEYTLEIQASHLRRASGEPLKIDTSDFPDLSSPAGSRGASGSGARRIHVRASIGDVVLGTGPMPDVEGLSNCREAKLERTIEL